MEKGWTQEDLAAKADLSTKTISNLECNHSASVKTLSAVSQALECRPEAIVLKGVLWNVPESLPSHFVGRKSALAELRVRLLGPVRSPMHVAGQRTVGVCGMGGVGKTALATYAAHDLEIRKHFSDGILWLRCGQRADVLRQQANLVSQLGSEKTELSDSISGRRRLRELLEKKKCLLILDDVWEADAARALEVVGEDGRILITTRDGTLLTSLGAEEIRVDPLSADDAVDLLGSWSARPLQDSGEADEILKSCGGLPLALVICGALARDGMAWATLGKALQDEQWECLRPPTGIYHHETAFRAMQASVDTLKTQDAIAAARYCELCVFPKAAMVPERTVFSLWQRDGKLSDIEREILFISLARKSLLRIEGTEPNRRIALHDLQHDFLIARYSAELKRLNGEVLDAYWDQCSDGWATGPNDGYFFEHLTYHLSKADRHEELEDLLLDFSWLKSKLRATDAIGLLSDFKYASRTEAMLVGDALRLSAHWLAVDEQQLHGQIYGRLASECATTIRSLLKQAIQPCEYFFLFPSTGLTQPSVSLRQTLEGHRDSVHSVAVSPDGAHIVSGARDGIKIWDFETGKPLCTLRSQPSGSRPFLSNDVLAVEVTPNGRCVFSASADGTIKFWDFETGKQLRSLTVGDGGADIVAVSPDGGHVISSSTVGTIGTWDTMSGRRLRTFETNLSTLYKRCVMTPDGQYLIVGTHHDIKIWDFTRGKELRTLQGHCDTVSTVAVTPDGEHVVSGSRDEMIKIWDLATGNELRTLQGHRGSVSTVAVTPDGEQVVSGSEDNTIRIWDLATGNELRMLKGHGSHIEAVAVTPDGQHIVSGSSDHHVKIWERTVHCDAARRVSDPCNATPITADSRSMHVGCHRRGAFRVAVSPNGAHVISGLTDSTISIWCFETGKNLQTLKGHGDFITALAVTPDDRHIISGSWDRTVRIWDLKTGEQLRTLEGHRNWISALSVTPGSDQVISGSWDGTVRIWDLKTGEQLRVLRGSCRSVTAVAVTPDGKHIISGYDLYAKIWNLETGEELRILEFDLMKDERDGSFRGWGLNAIAVSANGELIISGLLDGTIRITNFETGEELRRLTYRAGEFTLVATSPDGFSGSAYDTIIVCDLEAKLKAQFKNDNPIWSYSVSRDGGRMAIVDHNGHVHFIQLVPPVLPAR